MDKSVPVWFFLLTLLIGAMFTMAFGWSVRSTTEGSDRSGIFGQVAAQIVEFPRLVRLVAKEIRSNADEQFLVPRNIDLSEFSPVKQRPGIDVSGLLFRADRGALAPASGWRILVGMFTIGGELKNAALVLSPELEITRAWILTETEIDGEDPAPPHRKTVHGFDILSDGSFIFAFGNNGISLQRFDPCGSRIWAVGGKYHHSVALDNEEEFVWALRGELELVEIVKLATASGEVLRNYSMNDIIEANPALDILGIRQSAGALQHGLELLKRNMSPKWLHDPFHLNDIDPLPLALSDRFEEFAAGDLLVSARNLNLIFVMDPDTLEVKWWRVGATRRQHDPDWGRNGKITVLDNRMDRDYSRIVNIAPKSFRTELLFDGRSNDFYTRRRGEHQFTESGNLIVTSTEQGRVFEIDPDGNVVLEIINNKAENNEFNYLLQHVIWLPPNALNFGEDMSCSKERSASAP